MRKIAFILLLLPSVLFGQLDIVKRTLDIDSIRARGTNIYLKDNAVFSGNASFGVGGPAVYKVGDMLYFWDDTTGAKSLYELSLGGSGSGYMTLTGSYLYPNLNNYNLAIGANTTLGYSATVHKFLVNGTSYFKDNVYIEPGKYLNFIGSASINEFSIDGTLAGNSNNAVPTEKAVKTYVDGEIAAFGTNHFKRAFTHNLYTTNATDNLILGQTDGFPVTTYKLFVNGTTLFNGPIVLGDTITGVSRSTTLAGNSNYILPTERAVKTYVDNAVLAGNVNLSSLPNRSVLFEAGDTISGDANFTWDGVTLQMDDGGSNVFIGAGGVGSNIDVYQNNVFIGNGAGVTGGGDDGVLIGRYAGNQLGSGAHGVIGIGSNAIGNSAGGPYMIAIGQEAGYNTSTVPYNIFIGYRSGYTNTTGYSNTFLGTSSGYSNTTGYHNVFVGDSAGYKVAGGFSNTIMGTMSGLNQTSGRYSTFIGEKAGRSNTTKHYNTFIGYQAGDGNTGGDYSVIVGANAGFGVTDATGSTMIGYNAGYSSSGNQNTLLGYWAGALSATGNVMIGYNAGANETGSNKLYIENSNSSAPLIKGDFAGDSVTINGSLILTGNDALTLTGSAVVWDDLMFPFETGTTAGTGYPAFVPDSGYYDFSAVDTAAPGQCIMYFTVQMPHRWDDGTIIYPHVHYKHETTVGTPKFRVKYKWVNIGGAVPSAWNYCDLQSTTGTTNNTHQISYSSTGMNGSGKTLSSVLLVQLYLSAAPASVKAYQFDLHYAIDRLGSRTETAK